MAPLRTGSSLSALARTCPSGSPTWKLRLRLANGPVLMPPEVENMPWGIRWTTYFIPLKYYLTIIRGVFLKAAGPAVLWPHGLVLLAWGAGILTLATLRFHKRLD